jgi:hypothetical protein
MDLMCIEKDWALGRSVPTLYVSLTPYRGTTYMMSWVDHLYLMTSINHFLGNDDVIGSLSWKRCRHLIIFLKNVNDKFLI